jgi:hypothetical protein
MWPFYGCVSLGPIRQGRCGNCCWAGGDKCSWEDELEDGREPNPMALGKAHVNLNRPAVSVKLASWPVGDLIKVDLEAEIRAQEERFARRRPGETGW